MLGKLYISAASSAAKLHAVHELVGDAIDAKIATDAPSRNALTKLQAAVVKAIGAGGPAASAAAAAAAKNDVGEEAMTVVVGDVEVEGEG